MSRDIVPAVSRDIFYFVLVCLASSFRFFGLVCSGFVDGVFGNDGACFAFDGDGVIGVDERDDLLFSVVVSGVEFA